MNPLSIMMKRCSKMALVAVMLLGSAAVATADQPDHRRGGEVHPMHAPPPPKREAAGKRAGYVWVEGRYDFRDGKYVWLPGHWERAQQGKRYRQGRWDKRGDRSSKTNSILG